MPRNDKANNKIQVPPHLSIRLEGKVNKDAAGFYLHTEGGMIRY
jgi:hypothetical protein